MLARWGAVGCCGTGSRGVGCGEGERGAMHAVWCGAVVCVGVAWDTATWLGSGVDCEGAGSGQVLGAWIGPRRLAWSGVDGLGFPEVGSGGAEPGGWVSGRLTWAGPGGTRGRSCNQTCSTINVGKGTFHTKTRI